MIERKLHRSKADAWLILLVFGIGAFITLKAGATLMNIGLRAQGMILAGLVVFYWGVIFLLAWPVRYEIRGEMLVISAGLLLKAAIPVKAIVRVGPTRNPLSAPAWSLDRLRLDYINNGRKGFALVSPEDKELFIRHLLEVNPRIEITGGSKGSPEPEPTG